MHDKLHETVPAELRERPQWVCWKYVDRAGKPTKVPVNPEFVWNASATDPSTWTTFGDAVAASERYAGVGFVFTENDPFAGLDLDDCLDERGNLVWGNELLAEFDTYTEVSPSGTGPESRLAARSGPRTPASAAPPTPRICNRQSARWCVW